MFAIIFKAIGVAVIRSKYEQYKVSLEQHVSHMSFDCIFQVYKLCTCAINLTDFQDIFEVAFASAN